MAYREDLLARRAYGGTGTKKPARVRRRDNSDCPSEAPQSYVPLSILGQTRGLVFAVSPTSRIFWRRPAAGWAPPAVDLTFSLLSGEPPFSYNTMSMLPFSLLEDISLPSSLSISTSSRVEERGSDGSDRQDEDSTGGSSWAADPDTLIAPSTNQSTGQPIGGENASMASSERSFMVLDPQEPAVMGFPPGTLIEFIRGRQNEVEDVGSNEDTSCGGTIVSSAPSGGFEPVVAPAQESHEAWALSPHPNFALGSAHSLATTMTRSIDDAPDNDAAAVMNEDESVDTYLLSLAPSTWMDSSMDDSETMTSGDTRSSHLVRHPSRSFMNVGNRLALPSQGNANAEPTYWYSRFTDQDWLNFQQQAEMVLQALEPPTAQHAVLALPPAPPADEEQTPTVEARTDYNACDWLPEQFICKLCDDVIIGAVTLSCGCAASTVCMSCWETHIITTGTESDGELEYVHIKTSSSCPFCQATVDKAVPCHALDVAILHAVRNIPPGSPFQPSYYNRLRRWRNEVQQRIAWQSSRQSFQADRILAELIQEEERYFWKKRQSRPRHMWNQGILLLGEVTICLAVATISALGVNRCGRQ